ncbi:MAG: PleD family two-component system response regulator [Bacteriovoracia bacterium]
MQKSKKTILVIDDSADSRLMIRKVLEAAGLSVHEADNLSSGFAATQAAAPHLIVLDLILAQETGFEFLERRAKDSRLSTVPVLVVSGLKDQPSVYKAIVLGANDYLTKPIDSRTLVQKTWKLLRDRRFARVEFPPKEQPTVQASVAGQILMANEVGFLIELPMKLAGGTQLNIRSKLLTDLACEDSVFQKTENLPRPTEPGRYLNEVAAIGLSQATIDRIRKLVRGWK